jgi:hypothetical protein
MRCAFNSDVRRFFRATLVPLAMVTASALFPVATGTAAEGSRARLSGIYMSEPCDSHRHGSDTTELALSVRISPEAMELHVGPDGTTRIIEMEPTGGLSRGITHYRYVGMGKWEGNTLVVETRGPVSPMWYLDAPVSALRETFSFADDVLTYEAWPTLRKVPNSRPIVSVALGKCE